MKEYLQRRIKFKGDNFEYPSLYDYLILYVII